MTGQNDLKRLISIIRTKKLRKTLEARSRKLWSNCTINYSDIKAKWRRPLELSLNWPRCQSGHSLCGDFQTEKASLHWLGSLDRNFCLQDWHGASNQGVYASMRPAQRGKGWRAYRLHPGSLHINPLQQNFLLPESSKYERLSYIWLYGNKPLTSQMSKQMTAYSLKDLIRALNYWKVVKKTLKRWGKRVGYKL